MKDPQPKNPKDAFPEWTEDFIESKLAQFGRRAWKFVSPPALAGPYHKAAAVLVTFNPDTLEPFESAGENDVDAFDALMADATVVYDQEGRPASMLRSDVRQRVLTELGGASRMQSALAANPNRPQTSLQAMFEAYIQSSAPDIQQQTLDQLGATLQVIEWLPANFPGLPEVAEVRQLVERESLLKPFRDLANETFVGREDELRKLRIYVDFLPSQGFIESAERLLSWTQQPPRIIYAPGGMGKSALMSKFILDHLSPKDGSRPIPFVYLDFDRPTLAAEEPRTLLLEGARQLVVQFPSMSSLAALHGRWQSQMTPTSRPELSTMVNDFGGAFRGSAIANDPLLFVADTFEEVQYQGPEITGAVIELLASLQEQIPRLRAVFSGRAPVTYPRHPTDNVPLEKLKTADATGYMIRFGVPAAVAAKVAGQVGGNPLTLKLAVEVLQHEGFNLGGIADLEIRDKFLRRLQDSRIQGQLYRRILRYIKDDEVRKLAYPGLVLRRITRGLIRDVLAKPCGVVVDNDETAKRLFEGLQRVVSLVTPAEDGSLRHRPEVREVMLEMMRRDESSRVFAIQSSAVEFYRKNAKSAAEKAERLYHLAALGRPRRELEAAWESGLAKYLGGVLPELPPASRAFLAPLIQEPLDEEAKKYLAREDTERAAAQRARNFFLLERPEAAREALTLPYPDPSATIWMLRGVACVQLNRWQEAAGAIDSAFVNASGSEDPHLILKLHVLEGRVKAETARKVDVALTSSKRLNLQSAVLSAFPKYENLNVLAATLGKDLLEISKSQSPDSAAFDLVRWAEENAAVEDLIAEGRRLNATDMVLKTFADAAGIDPAISPSAARMSSFARGQSFGRRLADEYGRLIVKFLDDPRLLRLGLYTLQQYVKRGDVEERYLNQLEKAIADLFQRIPQNDLLNFGPLCIELAGRLGPKYPAILSGTLGRFGTPELNPDARKQLNDVLTGWDESLNHGIGKLTGQGSELVLKGDPIQLGRTLQTIFERFGANQDAIGILASNMSRAGTRVPEKLLYEELERASQFWPDAAQLTASLTNALNGYDWSEAAKISNEIIERLKEASLPFPEAPAHRMLISLRRKRQFSLMESLASAFLQGPNDTSPQIHRQYAQALIDQGNFTAARLVLKSILDDPSSAVAEKAEANGLMGRIYKQLYVNANDPSNPEQRSNLNQAVRCYYGVFETDPKTFLWHGINSVALLERARRDLVALEGFPPAIDIENQIDLFLKQNSEPAYWDLAIAVENAVAMGRNQDAYDNALYYLADPQVDAFECASLLRQLTEVWQLKESEEPGRTLIPTLKAYLLQKQGGQLDVARENVSSDAQGAQAANDRLEKVFGSDRYQPLAWYRTGLKRCEAVARIESVTGRRVGTAFLVRATDFFPDRDVKELLLLTNSHVISPLQPPFPDSVAPDAARAVFEANNLTCGVGKVVWSSPPGEFDATFVTVNGLGENSELCPLVPAAAPFQPPKQQRVYVIGYPLGGGLSFSLQDSIWLDTDDRRLHYRTPTEPGSSGSPVFDEQYWTLIGLHHAGGPNMPRLRGGGTYPANEAIAISAIQKAIHSAAKA